MLGRARPNWKHLLGDLVTVFVGILLALWVDGMATARVERGERARVVADLSRDLARDSAQLDLVMEFQAARTADLEALINASNSGLWPVDGPSLAAVLNSMGLATMTSIADTYEDLEASGQLAEVLSRDERVRLRHYYRRARTPQQSKAAEWREWAMANVPDPHWRLLLPEAPNSVEAETAAESDSPATRGLLDFIGTAESQARLRLLLAEAQGNMRTLKSTQRTASMALQILRGT